MPQVAPAPARGFMITPDPQEQRERIGTASGIVEGNILRELQGLGYLPDTASLLRLTPLVEVAWADGEITNSERAMILGTAATRQVEWESAAYYQLLDWMAHQPSSDFFEKSWRALRSALDRLPVDQRTMWRQDLISACSHVALASEEVPGSGLWMCEAERNLIDRFAWELNPSADTPGCSVAPEERR